MDKTDMLFGGSKSRVHTTSSQMKQIQITLGCYSIGRMLGYDSVSHTYNRKRNCGEWIAKRVGMGDGLSGAEQSEDVEHHDVHNVEVCHILIWRRIMV